MRVQHRHRHRALRAAIAATVCGAATLAMAGDEPTVLAADTTMADTVCSWSFGRWSVDDDGALAADLRARAIAADGRILAYRLRDDVDAEALLLDLSAALGGGRADDAAHWVVEETGPGAARPPTLPGSPRWPKRCATARWSRPCRSSIRTSASTC